MAPRHLPFGSLLLAPLLLAVPEAAPPEQCAKGTKSSKDAAVTSMAMLQVHADRGHFEKQVSDLDARFDDEQSSADEHGAMSVSARAAFLMRATFGPTRQSMADLATKSPEEWFMEQKALPASLHRSYFRERASPLSDPTNQAGFSDLPVCAKGSRWFNHVLLHIDVDLPITISEKPGGGKEVLIDGVWRTDLDPAHTGNGISPVECANEMPEQWLNSKKTRTCEDDASLGLCCNPNWKQGHSCEKTCFEFGEPTSDKDCSGGWPNLGGEGTFEGFVCEVRSVEQGAIVAFSKNKNCKNPIYAHNPIIWVEQPPAETELTFETNERIPGVIFLADDSSDCGLDPSGVLNYKGKPYLHQRRMRMLENTELKPSPTLDSANCIKQDQFNEKYCVVLPQSIEGCDVACGSPGEVANKPSEGHLFTIHTAGIGVAPPDQISMDSIHRRSGQFQFLPKSIVWTMRALKAEDQLRQRMAFALSQIIVASVLDSGDDSRNEYWLAFYDKFVRFACGNYLDLLREVTYCPVMGKYLSYKSSSSFDASGSYPDENYAREIMQLFTIGLAVLYPNGTAVKSSSGETVPTYTNEHIMNFARVMTGFRLVSTRANQEVWARNNIDNMYIDPHRHDVYPKPDLLGNYLGDSYPLCADLPPKSFLGLGAKYSFLGYSYNGEAMVLSPSSALFGALCNGESGACHFQATVTLESSLDCSDDEECKVTYPDVFQVDSAFYTYVPPPCVYHFFFNGKTIKHAEGGRTYCAHPETPLAGVTCSKGCSNRVSRWMTRKGHTCEGAHETWVKRGEPVMTTQRCRFSRDFVKNKYCERTCWEADVGYDGSDCSAGEYEESLHCHHGHQAMTYSAAVKHCQSLGMSLTIEHQADCGQEPYIWTDEDCASEIEVFADGKVAGHTDHTAPNRFWVAWAEETGAPPPGSYTVEFELRAVFLDQVPSAEDALASLKIGAYPPSGSCTSGCDGDVKAYGGSEGQIDAETVFEVAGKYFKNAESVVLVGNSSFRNPPAFMPFPAGNRAKLAQHVTQRAAENEVESMLQHLIQHPSTPGAVGKKLIQRFVTSNPSPEYLAAVAEAFSTGTFRDLPFSGVRGDLSATLAAILLHPEAQSENGRSSAGLLREPMLKIMHVLRSLEYSEHNGEEVVMARELRDRIGQFPHYSPSVFNFFDADFMPARFRSQPEAEPEPEPEAKPEAEPEPEPEAEEEHEMLVAPEFQLFTPPRAMTLLNGLATALELGVSRCEDGLGTGAVRTCERGTLDFTPESNAVEELNVMLTGGRLTPRSLELVTQVYEAAEEGERLEKTQQAIFLTPEFNSLGNPKPESATRPPPAPAPPTGARDYKALVMLFLAGGADTFHMLVPLCHLFNEYQEVRGGAAHEQSVLHPITAGDAQPGCDRFGLHPELHFLSELYEQEEQAAFVSNIGALVEPVTKSTMKGKKLCLGLFSHSHQQRAAQTLDCDVTGGRGVGGKLGDTLAKEGYKVESFSVAGQATWSEGVQTKVEVIDKQEGAVRFNGYEEWSSVINNITQEKYGNVYCDEYVQALGEAVESSNKLGELFENITLETDFPTDTRLALQLRQVAKLIKAREQRGAERDYFFVQTTGYDTHTNLHTTFAANMAEVDAGLSAFVTELKAQGNFDNTVVVSASDFGRTLSFNGEGTDHGWGGNHFVLGGKVKGKQVLNEFPRTLALETEYDAGRGRVIPEFPWESVMVPIARWLGVSDLSSVFPNLGNFNGSRHIIPQSTLFHP